MAKWVYLFKEGDASMRNLLGGKGANLAEMTNLGLPIPQGFTVTTEACTDYYESGERISHEVEEQIMAALVFLEGLQGKKFGDTEDPLLVSVRSGARASMPGMMDTILNLGLNDVSVEGFAKKTGNPRFAYDSYRRFIQMYSDVVMEVPKSYFEKIIDEVKEAKGVQHQGSGTGGQGSGDEEPLALSAGEVGAPDVQTGVQFVRQGLDEFPGLGGFRGGDHVFPGEVPQEGDVFVDAVVQQGLTLKDHAEAAPQILPAKSRDVLPASPDQTLVRVVKPEKKGDQGGLSRAGGAQDAQSLPFI